MTSNTIILLKHIFLKNKLESQKDPCIILKEIFIWMKTNLTLLVLVLTTFC